MTAALSRAGVGAFHDPRVRRAAFALAAARGRALVLLYHRVTPAGPSPADVMPVVSTAQFRAQLDALREVAEFAPLAALDEAPAGGTGRARDRVRVAVTFDDDEPAHVRDALPVLRALGVPATFFLMGRALHGLGAPWWVLLEHAIARRGLPAVAAALGLDPLGDDARTPAALAARCEGTPLAERAARELALPNEAPLLGARGVRALAAAGMEVGFHTLEHPVLTGLPDDSARRALGDGRDALAAAAGQLVERLAYPHGRADARVAALAREAGYRAAYRTGNRAVSALGAPTAASLRPWWLARWEPGPLAPEQLLAHAAFRLTLPVGAPRRASSPASGAPAGGAPRPAAGRSR